MYTQCPGCYSIYRIEPHALAHGRGLVCCSVCELVFNATAGLRERLPESRPALQPDDNAILDFDEPPAESRDDAVAADDAEADDAAIDDPEPAQEETPPEEKRPPSRRRFRWWWPLGCAALFAILVGQVLWRAPEALARYPALRPLAETLCTVSDCALKPRQDLSAIRLLSRDVRAHPSVPGGLIVSATLVNQAEFFQPYPRLELGLSDLDGRLVAMRRFDPAVYLPGGVAWREGMPPGSRARVNLELVDPGADAVGFEFSFVSSPLLGRDGNN